MFVTLEQQTDTEIGTTAKLLQKNLPMWKAVRDHYRILKGHFPGGPVVKLSWFHCRGHGLDPWSGS